MIVSIPDIKELAVFVAQLVREGVRFSCKQVDGEYLVIFTGGY